MTHLLPPNLLRNFAPRAAIPYIKPAGPDWYNELGDRKLEGLAGILDEIRAEAALKEAEAEDEEAKKSAKTTTGKDLKSVAKAAPEAGEEGAGPAKTDDAKMEEPEETGEIIEESKEQVGELAIKKAEEQGLSYTEAEKYRLRQLEKKRKREENFKAALAAYKPTDDPEAVGDPYKTLFISRLHYNATEEDLRREFGMYGPIERLTVVRVKSSKNKGKSRGYAFILYEREKDMKAAYKDAEGIKILGRRILVDVERGRTVKGWKPRRLGGGLGGRPKPVSAADAPAPSFGGGRGGFGGGRGGGFAGRGGFGGGRGGGGFGGPPRGGGGFGGAPRGGGVGFRGGFGGGDRGGDRGGGGGFNQKDIIGQQGSGWGSRAPGGGSTSGPPPSQGGGFGGSSSQGGYGGSSGGGYQSRVGAPSGPAGYGGNFEVPRGSSGGGGGGYDSRDSRGGGYGGDRGGYGDRDAKRPRY